MSGDISLITFIGHTVLHCIMVLMICYRCSEVRGCTDRGAVPGTRVSLGYVSAALPVRSWSTFNRTSHQPGSPPSLATQCSGDYEFLAKISKI